MTDHYVVHRVSHAMYYVPDSWSHGNVLGNNCSTRVSQSFNIFYTCKNYIFRKYMHGSLQES